MFAIVEKHQFWDQMDLILNLAKMSTRVLLWVNSVLYLMSLRLRFLICKQGQEYLSQEAFVSIK